MTNAELDALKTAADMRAWHELNKDDPQCKEAVAFMRHAVMALEEAESYLRSAADAVDGTPESDRILSLNIDTEELECDIRTQIERMK